MRFNKLTLINIGIDILNCILLLNFVVFFIKNLDKINSYDIKSINMVLSGTFYIAVTSVIVTVIIERNFRNRWYFRSINQALLTVLNVTIIGSILIFAVVEEESTLFMVLGATTIAFFILKIMRCIVKKYEEMKVKKKCVNTNMEPGGLSNECREKNKRS